MMNMDKQPDSSEPSSDQLAGIVAQTQARMLDILNELDKLSRQQTLLKLQYKSLEDDLNQTILTYMQPVLQDKCQLKVTVYPQYAHLISPNSL